MPNTLAHAGVQGILTRAANDGIDRRWIYLGCVIPDVPWILQRAVRMLELGVDPFVLRSFVIIQASLLGCLVLSAGVALLARSFWKAYGVLAANCLVHLILDACQTKWANGVHFIAPFSWEVTNWGFFWPESTWTVALTGIGLIYVVYWVRVDLRTPVDLDVGRIRLVAVLGVAVMYFLGPLAIVDQPDDANAHYLRTLTADERTGMNVGFDRARYLETDRGMVLEFFGSRRVSVRGIDARAPATVSIQGVFTDHDQIRVTRYHVHEGGMRDAASYVGLALIMMVWALPFAKAHPFYSAGG